MASTIQITSMLDMFTIILVFLLNFLDPANETDPEIALPVAGVSDPAGEGVPVLTVTRTHVRLQGQPLFPLEGGRLPADLQRDGRRIRALYDGLSGLPRAVPNGDEDTSTNAALSVHCDRAVPFSLLGELLYTAGAAGYTDFRFVVISDAG
jgi:hypothetical protein